MSACDSLRKTTWIVAIVVSACFAPACKSNERAAGKQLLLERVLELRHQISVQFLRLATDRDAVSDGVGSVVDHCNPKSSDDAYRRVHSELDQLVSRLSKGPLEAKAADQLRAIRDEWVAVSLAHHKIWQESEGANGISPEDRCLRLSAIASRILSIEANFDAIIKYAASPR